MLKSPIYMAILVPIVVKLIKFLLFQSFPPIATTTCRQKNNTSEILKNIQHSTFFKQSSMLYISLEFYLSFCYVNSY